MNYEAASSEAASFFDEAFSLRSDWSSPSISIGLGKCTLFSSSFYREFTRRKILVRRLQTRLFCLENRLLPALAVRRY